MSQPRARMDDSLKPVYQKLNTIYQELRELRKRGGYTGDHLTKYQDQLHEIEMAHSAHGVFASDVASVPAGQAPAGQARISTMLHRCYRLVHSMLSTTEFDPK